MVDTTFHLGHVSGTVIVDRVELDALREAVRLALDFHGADTEAFVARYGHGMTTRDLCDQLREALAHHATPQAGEQEKP